jgi:ubiquinone/menaquinone biosynthesis C-methylase UbiE
VGCGNGALFDSIGPQRVLGVDPNIDGLRHSTRRHPGVAFLCADGARLPLADESVDVVTAQHVIEHIADYQQAVAEWFRVLRPGGRLILVTPNGEFADPSVFADDSHVCILDRSALRRTVATAGFDILETCTLGLPWFRDYHRLPSVWRLRRFVTGRAHALAAVPPWRWKGQTLCCAAARPG